MSVPEPPSRRPHHPVPAPGEQRRDQRGANRLERRVVERHRAARRRRGIILALLLAAAVLAGVDFVRGGITAPDPLDVRSADGKVPSIAPISAPPPSPSVVPSASASVTPSATPSPKPTVPKRGSGKFATAPGGSKVFGSGGATLRYRVRVETDIADLTSEFVGYVDSTLGDRRSWIAGGAVRLQRTASAPYDFTVYLATPATTDKLCAPLPTSGYTSCRQGDKVVVNLARWVYGVEHWDADLDTYRQYVINHEVGHRLGHRHERCPGNGRPAPVMQQQTLKLDGCTGNAWPYLDGKLHTGPPGGYS